MEEYINENQLDKQEDQPSSFLSNILQTIKQSKMSLALFIFAGIVLLFSIVIIILAFANKPAGQTPAPTSAINQSQSSLENPTERETAGWKEYLGNIITTNQNGTFYQKMSIKYPQEWFIDSQDTNNLIFIENGNQYKIRINQTATNLPVNSNTNCNTQPNVSLGQYTADQKVCRSGTIINLFVVSIGNNNIKTNINFDVPPTNQDQYLKIYGKMLTTFQILPGLFPVNQVLQQNQTGANPTPTDSMDTSNWKTYTNTEYGFSIKYPQDYSTSEVNYPSASPDYSEVLGAIVIQKENFRINITAAKANQNIIINKTLDSILSNGPGLSYNKDFLKGKVVKRIVVDGINAVEVNGLPVGQVGSTSDVIVLKDNIVYEITAAPDENNKLSIFDQILSTFKFTQ